MNFGPARAHHVTFLADDARTSVGRRLYVQSEDELAAFVARAGGDPEDLRAALRQWGQGSVWLNLTHEQYERLTGKKQAKPTREV